jgi:hypothetical protein
LWRLNQSTTSTAKANAAAAIKATRQEKAMARGTSSAGARAHPRLPVIP